MDSGRGRIRRWIALLPKGRESEDMAWDVAIVGNLSTVETHVDVLTIGEVQR